MPAIFRGWEILYFFRRSCEIQCKLKARGKATTRRAHINKQWKLSASSKIKLKWWRKRALIQWKSTPIFRGCFTVPPLGAGYIAGRVGKYFLRVTSEGSIDLYSEVCEGCGTKVTCARESNISIITKTQRDKSLPPRKNARIKTKQIICFPCIGFGLFYKISFRLY